LIRILDFVRFVKGFSSDFLHLLKTHLFAGVRRFCTRIPEKEVSFWECENRKTSKVGGVPRGHINVARCLLNSTGAPGSACRNRRLAYYGICGRWCQGVLGGEFRESQVKFILYSSPSQNALSSLDIVLRPMASANVCRWGPCCFSAASRV
jgi:hypothetical protein